MGSAVRVVLSDLDDTLFDHSHASRSALAHLHRSIPAFSVWSHDALDERHRTVLEELHLEVLAGRLSVDRARIERFTRLLQDAGADRAADLAADVAREYRGAYERSWQPVAGAVALAAAIHAASVPFVIVTNNIVSEQKLKLARTGLAPFVTALVTSEEVGITKPDPGIFLEALSRVRLNASDAVMLGDSWETDIVGATRAGLRSIWLNRTGRALPDPAIGQIASLEPAADVLRVLGIGGYGAV